MSGAQANTGATPMQPPCIAEIPARGDPATVSAQDKNVLQGLTHLIDGVPVPLTGGYITITKLVQLNQMLIQEQLQQTRFAFEQNSATTADDLENRRNSVESTHYKFNYMPPIRCSSRSANFFIIDRIRPLAQIRRSAF